MTRNNLYAGAARWALFLALAATPLAGCKPAASSDQAAAPSDAIPLASGAAPALAAAPAASALPPAPPIPLGRLANPGDRYAFADRAYAMNNAFADAPPDYGFDYDGTQPWVWRGDNGAMRVAEPLPDGGDRYYYYQPGADYPYLVRDPQYSYGYDNGELVVIYDSGGRPLPDSEFQARRDYASRFFSRGRALYSTSQQQQQRQAVAAANWAARRNQYAAEQSRLTSDQQKDTDWRDYHQAHQDQYRDQWAAERARRANEGAQFAATINDTQTANRDRQIARQAQAHAGQSPPPRPGTNILGVHIGGGSPPKAPPPPLAPAGPAAGPAAPGGGDHHRDHDHAQAGPPGSVGPTPAAPSGPPRHEAAPPRIAPVAPAAKPPAFTPPKPVPPNGEGQRPFEPAIAHRTPPMHPMTPTPPAPVPPRPVEPRAAVIKPVPPTPRPPAPKAVVVKPKPPTPPPPPKRPTADKDLPNKQ